MVLTICNWDLCVSFFVQIWSQRAQVPHTFHYSFSSKKIKKKSAKEKKKLTKSVSDRALFREQVRILRQSKFTIWIRIQGFECLICAHSINKYWDGSSNRGREYLHRDEITATHCEPSKNCEYSSHFMIYRKNIQTKGDKNSECSSEAWKYWTGSAWRSSTFQTSTESASTMLNVPRLRSSEEDSSATEVVMLEATVTDGE